VDAAQVCQSGSDAAFTGAVGGHRPPRRSTFAVGATMLLQALILANGGGAATRVA
jgi:hypothetical protein